MILRNFCTKLQNLCLCKLTIEKRLSQNRHGMEYFHELSLILRQKTDFEKMQSFALFSFLQAKLQKNKPRSTNRWITESAEWE